MKKLFYLLLLFAYFTAKSEDLSLSYTGEALVHYAKPYIYIIDRDRYFTIKIPEMKKSEPIYFAEKDSTIFNLYAPSTYTLSKINSTVYLSQGLGGLVYELRGNKIVRIDKSFMHKMQINAQNFEYDNRIFRFGGYGFWTARNFFTYFDLNTKEWEAYSPVQGDLPPGLFDVNQYKNGDDITYFNGISLNPYDNLKLEQNLGIWHFNLKTKIWDYRGKTALFFGNNIHNFQHENYYYAFTDDRKIIRVNFQDDTYEVFTNEALTSKIAHNFRPFIEGNKIYYFVTSHSTHSNDLISIPITSFLGQPLLKADLIETNYWMLYGQKAIALIAFIAIALIVFYLLKNRKVKANHITDKEGLFYLGKAAINFDEVELKVLTHLLKNNDVPNSELLTLVEQKGVHFSHNIRVKNDVLNQINLKLKAILQVDLNFIIFKKSDTDSRLKVYRLNKQYFKLSKEFLNK
jgi:hypothetical protein